MERGGLQGKALPMRRPPPPPLRKMSSNAEEQKRRGQTGFRTPLLLPWGSAHGTLKIKTGKERGRDLRGMGWEGGGCSLFWGGIAWGGDSIPHLSPPEAGGIDVQPCSPSCGHCCPRLPQGVPWGRLCHSVPSEDTAMRDPGDQARRAAPRERDPMGRGTVGHGGAEPCAGTHAATLFSLCNASTVPSLSPSARLQCT